MRHAFTLTTASYVVLLGLAAVLLPARVPLHVTPTGEVDRWGSRLEALVVMGLSGAVLALVLGVGARVMRTAPLTSPWVNLPHKAWWSATPAREAEARRRLRTDLLGVGAAAMLLMDLVLVALVVTARAEESVLVPLLQATVVAAVVGLVAWALWMSLFRYRPEEGR